MAITFLEQRKKQQNLLPILVGVLLITAFVMWWGYFRDSSSVVEVVEIDIFSPSSRIEINFSIFENPWFDNFEPFEKAPAFEGEKGKENPFVSDVILEE